MKKVRLYLCVGLITLFCSCQENFSARCAREAKEYTEKNCPKQLQPEIRMDSLTFDEKSQTLTYFYTLSGRLDDETAIATAKDQMHTTVLNALKNDVNLRLYKEHNLNFGYVWYSTAKKNKKLLEMTFGAKEYK